MLTHTSDQDLKKAQKTPFNCVVGCPHKCQIDINPFDDSNQRKYLTSTKEKDIYWIKCESLEDEDPGSYEVENCGINYEAGSREQDEVIVNKELSALSEVEADTEGNCKKR